MKTSELRSKQRVDLEKELASLKEELFKLRFQHATNRLDNPAQLKLCRRNIARVMTLMREQELNVKKAR